MGLAGLAEWLFVLTTPPAWVIHSTDLKPY